MMFLDLEEIELRNPIDFLGLGMLLPRTDLSLFLSLLFGGNIWLSERRSWIRSVIKIKIIFRHRDHRATLVTISKENPIKLIYSLYLKDMCIWALGRKLMQ